MRGLGRRVVAWLVGSGRDHARFVAMDERFARAPVYGLAIGGCTVAASLTYGVFLLALVAVAGVSVVAGRAVQSRSRSPEVVVAAVFALLVANLAACVLLTGGAHSPLLPLAVVPVFTQAAFFRSAVTLVGTLTTGLLVLAGVAGAALMPAVPAAPGALRVLVFAAMLGSMAPAARDLAASDLTSRDRAARDALTTLPNRRALDEHFAQVQQSARHRTGGGAGHRRDDRSGWVSLLVIDVDHFKSVNDDHGHDRGDRVLVELAHRFTGALRAGDAVYRVGGEEFVVLAPGTGRGECTAVAERVRQVVRAAPVDGLAVTVSVGVSCAPMATVALEDLFRAADQALYEAKRAGRDRVRTGAIDRSPARGAREVGHEPAAPGRSAVPAPRPATTPAPASPPRGA